MLLAADNASVHKLTGAKVSVEEYQGHGQGERSP